jgi:hypothetical protein
MFKQIWMRDTFQSHCTCFEIACEPTREGTEQVYASRKKIRNMFFSLFFQELLTQLVNRD